jgi:hypothetical protein
MIPTELTLKGLWLAVVAAAFAALLILLGVQTVRIEGFKVWPISVKGYRADLRDEKAAHRICHDNLATSNASIEALKQAAAEMIGAGKAAKVAQLAAVEKAAKDNAALQGQADAIRKEVAGMKPDGKCASPKSVTSAKGL